MKDQEVMLEVGDRVVVVGNKQALGVKGIVKRILNFEQGNNYRHQLKILFS